MIRIAITPAAFDTVTATLPLGSVGFEREPGERGSVALWSAVANRLATLRRAGESFSDVILRRGGDGTKGDGSAQSAAMKSCTK